MRLCWILSRQPKIALFDHLKLSLISSDTYNTIDKPAFENYRISIIGKPGSPEKRTKLLAPGRFVPEITETK